MDTNNEIPDSILKKAEKETQNLLPKKSKEVYSSEYEKFINWMTENCVEHISETVLLGYFSDLSENFSPSSLWSKYSMVKKTLMVNKNINIANYHKQGRCTVQPVGKNTFEKIPSIIAKYLGLSDPDKYTGHCMRRTSSTLLAEAGASMTTLKRHGGWKSTSVAEGYLEDSISSKNKLSRMLAVIFFNIVKYNIIQLFYLRFAKFGPQNVFLWNTQHYRWGKVRGGGKYDYHWISSKQGVAVRYVTQFFAYIS
ncbi:hypothetical protein NQ315_017474 [Exocentrus adspersus]|uniref:Tyr recombinase domain-containing protein n=1 Tax=Exocentrus adspersus TaxID=1586481 RepID=A0AAV8VJN7_9CUCU|nr:hypothetical protein NQ315_017474 [Exocentrus adspersus]